MKPEEVTLSYLMDTYKTREAIAQRFQVDRKSVSNWFNNCRVPLGRQQQYVAATPKYCLWCGIEISYRSPSLYCCREHKRMVEYEREGQKKAYGSHEFDGWVNRSWNGSGVRGHAIAA